MAWPAGVRDAVLRRAHRVCQACGSPGADEVDYVVPPSKGGAMRVENIGAICEVCLRAASSRPAIRSDR